MNIDAIAHAAMYGLAWFIISAGFTFILAAAFFGFPSDEEDEK
jgi:hypothetical protein